VEDDFKFNYADAKRQNQYEASDVAEALKFYQERSFEVPSSLPYEQETFTNRLGGEDAAFFDDYDNNQYYKVDGYASAGIPEAAPKVKREGRGGQQEEDEEDEEAFRELEDSKLMAAAYDEMGFDEADLDVADGETPWDWNESESTVVSTTAAATSSSMEANEQAIMDDLSRLDLDSNQEIPLEDRDAMALILDPELLNDVDDDDDVSDAPLPPLDASAQLTPVSLLAAAAAASRKSRGGGGGPQCRAGPGHVGWFGAAGGSKDQVCMEQGCWVGAFWQHCATAVGPRAGWYGGGGWPALVACCLFVSCAAGLHCAEECTRTFIHTCHTVAGSMVALEQHQELYSSSQWMQGGSSSSSSTSSTSSQQTPAGSTPAPAAAHLEQPGLHLLTWLLQMCCYSAAGVAAGRASPAVVDTGMLQGQHYGRRRGWQRLQPGRAMGQPTRVMHPSRVQQQQERWTG
jgi:hypothetical protein